MSASEIEDAFKLFDKDNNGEISVGELTALFRKLDSFLKPSELKAMLKFADRDNSGTVSLKEFTQLWTAIKTHSSCSDDDNKEMQREFSRLDKNGDGYITKSEMLKAGFISGLSHGGFPVRSILTLTMAYQGILCAKNSLVIRQSPISFHLNISTIREVWGHSKNNALPHRSFQTANTLEEVH